MSSKGENTGPQRKMGVAHLTLLHLSPPELIAVAATAGYDFVGVRVHPATPGESTYAMAPGSPMSKETILRLAETGLVVRDIEVLVLDSSTDREVWLPALEAGAALGASTFSVVGSDPDKTRLVTSLSQLTVDAAQFGIQPTLEPISYQAVSTVREAATLARKANCAVLLDALHIARGDNSLEDVRVLEPELVPVVQICDAPSRVPKSFDTPAKLPLGMTTNGSVRQVEARVFREVPGQGDLPLQELLRAVSPFAPLSVEVPNAIAQASMSDEDWASVNLAAMRRLAESSNLERSVSDG